jgi:hypothetical protein
MVKKPRFTDRFRYRNGYVDSKSTNVAETFRRIREELERNATEAKTKVASISRKKPCST